MNKAVLFNPGELYLQKKNGVAQQVASLASRLILDHLPSQHREFYSHLKMLFVASVDDSGQPWASVLVANPGFIHAIDEKLVRINAKPIEGDPLNENLKVEKHLGFLGLEFHTRRRNRMAGQIKYRSDDEIIINVDTAFGNCPKYIQTRNIKSFTINNTLANSNNITRIDFFDDNIKKLISSTNTFFIASYYPQLEFRGADVSHRGGKPGFVRIENDKTLSFDDYNGNNVFMTLGNLYKNPIVGLLFIDFKTGDLLQLACTSEIIDTPKEKHARKIRLRLQYGLFNKSALSIESDFLAYSPMLS